MVSSKASRTFLFVLKKNNSQYFLKCDFFFRGNKLNTVLNGGEMLLDSDWIRISDQVSEEWADHLTGTLALIGSTQKEGARLSGEQENPVNVEEVFKNTVKWLSGTTNSIDNEDAKVVERVSNYKVITISSESGQLQSFNTVFFLTVNFI